MKPFRLIRKLNGSQDLNKYVAVRFDAGKVQSEKYGEATLCGHLLLMNRYGEYPKVDVKDIESRVYGWLNEAGLEKHQDYVFEKINVHTLVAYMAPLANPEKLGLFFHINVLFFLIDDELEELILQNANNPTKHYADVCRLIRSSISIIESKGDGETTKKALSSNPMFDVTCKSLAHFCRNCFQRMKEDEYTHLTQALIDYIRVKKWVQEYCGSPLSENDYLFIRFADIGMCSIMYTAYLASDIRISNEIIMHPLFQKYTRSVRLYIGLTNDILSLRKEIAEDEENNIVLIKCRKYSLQESLYRAENLINELLFDIKKDELKLSLYFPADHNLKNLIRTAKNMVDGVIHWHEHSKRYGNMKMETYVVEYDSDYNTWLEKINALDGKTVEEPVLRVGSKNGAVVLSPFPSPPASNAT